MIMQPFQIRTLSGEIFAAGGWLIVGWVERSGTQRQDLAVLGFASRHPTYGLPVKVRAKPLNHHQIQLLHLLFGGIGGRVQVEVRQQAE